jgi:hypothetical protein
MSSFFHDFLFRNDDFNRTSFSLSRFPAKYRQSVNACGKPHFAGKSAGTGPFSGHSKNPSQDF